MERSNHYILFDSNGQKSNRVCFVNSIPRSVVSVKIDTKGHKSNEINCIMLEMDYSMIENVIPPSGISHKSYLNII